MNEEQMKDESRELFEGKMKTSADAVATTARIVASLHRPRIITLPDRHGQPAVDLLVTPVTKEKDGEVTTEFKVDPATNYQGLLPTVPAFTKGVAVMESLDSLIDHANRFKSLESALFASKKDGLSLQAVFDYHGNRNRSEGAPVAPLPDHCRHRAKYYFPLSEEWQAWMRRAKDGAMNMVEFAEFLEDRIIDVLPVPGFLTGSEPTEDLPDADRKLVEIVARIGGKPCDHVVLMTLAKGLKVHQAHQVEESYDRDGGNVSLKFKSENLDAAGKPLSVPTCFIIGIPIFENGKIYRLLVRLQHRVHGGKITWALQIHRAEQSLQDAFQEAAQKASEDSGLPVFYGSPEVG